MKKLSVILILTLLCGIFVSCNQEADIKNNGSAVGSQDAEISAEATETSNEITSDPSGNESVPLSEDSPKEGTEIKPAAGFIDYVATAYGFYPDDERGISDTIHLIKTAEELDDFYSENGIAVTDAFDESFFNEKAVIFIPFVRGSGSIGLELKHIYVENEKLIATVSEYMPEAGTDDMQYRLITAEIAKSSVENVTQAALRTEIQISGMYWGDEPEKDGETAEFTKFDFGGRIEKDIDSYSDGASFGWAEIVRNTYEFDRLLEKYTEIPSEIDINEITLFDFAERFNNEEYFKSKMFVLIPYSTQYIGVNIDITEMRYSEEQITFDMLVDESGAVGFEDRYGIMLIEFSKDIASDITNFCRMIDYTPYPFGAEPKDLEFSAKYFGTCGYSGNKDNVGYDEFANTPTLSLLDKESAQKLADKLKEEICDCSNNSDALIEYLEGLDDVFFRDNAILVVFFNTDEGETSQLKSISTGRYHGVPRMQMEVEFDDSVKPSPEEAAQSNAIVAIIDKVEMLGCGWVNCDFEAK